MESRVLGSGESGTFEVGVTRAAKAISPLELLASSTAAPPPAVSGGGVCISRALLLTSAASADPAPCAPEVCVGVVDGAATLVELFVSEPDASWFAAAPVNARCKARGRETAGSGVAGSTMLAGAASSVFFGAPVASSFCGLRVRPSFREVLVPIACASLRPAWLQAFI
jgi:hypothetical protein